MINIFEALDDRLFFHSAGQRAHRRHTITLTEPRQGWLCLRVNGTPTRGSRKAVYLDIWVHLRLFAKHPSEHVVGDEIFSGYEFRLDAADHQELAVQLAHMGWTLTDQEDMP